MREVPYYSDHDMEVSLDFEMDKEDIYNINKVRMTERLNNKTMLSGMDSSFENSDPLNYILFASAI